VIKKIILRIKKNKNYFYVFIGLGFSIFFAFANNLIIARQLNPSNYGLFFSILAIVMMFANLVVSGLPFYLQDQISNKMFSYKKIGNEIFLLFLLFIIFYFIILICWTYLGPNTIEDKKLLLSLSILIVFSPFIEIAKTLLQTKSKFLSISILNITVNFGRFLLIILVIFSSLKLDLDTVSVIYILGSFFPFIISLYLFSRYFNLRFVFTNFYKFFSSKLILQILNKTKFYISTNFLYFVYTSLDILIIKYKLSNFDAGIFFAAYSIILGLQIFGEATIRTFSFQYFKKIKSNIKSIKLFASQNTRFLMILVLPFCLIIFFYSDIIIELLYGDKYIISSGVLKYLVFLVPLRIISTNLSLITITKKRAYYNSIILLTILVIKIPLMLILIHYFALVGVVICLITLEILNLMLISYFNNQKILNAK
jgi:O-antigen/teichoic acid export membrane protein